jgi:hypothetical protein|tara:strand:+ start:94 stop:375 length:282 start_codon:yes stop_codon:yes gene_type:complete
MRVLLKKTRDILKLWSKENSIKDVSNIMGIPYKKLIDNYLKKFWKNDYLDKISKGRYILNKKIIKFHIPLSLIFPFVKLNEFIKVRKSFIKIK